jgi:hypothetical protein
MALTVTVAAGARDLTTVDAVKDELKIAASDTSEDFQLAEWIERASDAIRTYCDREFARQTYQETLAGHGGTLLGLSRTPVVSVTSVAHKGEPVVDFTIEDAEAGLLHRENGWYRTVAGTFFLDVHPDPRGDLPDYKAIYVAGYLLPGEDGRTLPRDVEKACIELVKAFRDTRIGGGQKLKSRTVGDVSETFMEEGEQDESDLPRNVTALLRNWKRPGF